MYYARKVDKREKGATKWRANEMWYEHKMDFDSKFFWLHHQRHQCEMQTQPREIYEIGGREGKEKRRENIEIMREENVDKRTEKSLNGWKRV